MRDTNCSNKLLIVSEIRQVWKSHTFACMLLGHWRGQEPTLWLQNQHVTSVILPLWTGCVSKEGSRTATGERDPSVQEMILWWLSIFDFCYLQVPSSTTFKLGAGPPELYT